MQTLCVLSEFKRGPSLPDRMHEWIEPRKELGIFTNQIWLSLLLLSIGYLIFKRKKEAINYLRVGGVVSIVRGIFIFFTSLGPPLAIRESPRFNENFSSIENLDISFLMQFYFPMGGILGIEKSVFYLTQDLFFSGHTASTYLLFVCLKKPEPLKYFFLFFHGITVVLLFLTHEHYTIDIMGAYFIVYAIYHYMEKNKYLVI